MSNFLINPYIVTTPLVTFATTTFTNNDANRLDPRIFGSTVAVGIKIIDVDALNITNPSLVKFIMQGKGSPSGTVSCKIYDEGGSVVATSSNTYAASSIPTSATVKEFNFDDSLTMLDDYHIAVLCSGSNNSDNSVGVKAYETRDESTIVTFAYNDGSWNINNDYNCGFYIEGT